MKLNKPIITICIIIILVVDLIFFSFLNIGKKANDKEFVNDVVLKFDFKKYLLNNDNIRNSIDNYKYPEEVFNYIDDKKVNELKKSIVDNLFLEKEQIVNKNDIIEILNNSVSLYEDKESIDIINFVKDDIESFASHVESKFDSSFISGYYAVKKFTSGLVYVVSIAVGLVCIGLIIFYEKKNGILLSSIILFIYSFFVYYVNKNFLEIGLKSVSKYFNKIDLQLDKLYVICFILGFVLLLIYMYFYLKKLARNIRINSYNRR